MSSTAPPTTGGTILVGYDGSPASMLALDWALRRAESTRSSVEVLFVADTSWDSDAFTAAPLLEQHGEVVTSAAAFHADSKAPHVAVISRVASGNPVTVLCAEAEAMGAELLVVGSYRKDLYERITTSAVSVRVAAAATVPVVIVPDFSNERADAAAGASGDAPLHRHGVVVGLDGGESSDAILAAAIAEAARLGEPVHAVTAWTLPPYTMPEFSDDTQFYDALEERARSASAAAILRADRRGPQRADGTAGAEVEVTSEVLLDSPVSALVTAAKEASLLVIGSHGRHGLSRFLLGSVSHDVIVHAPCPVLVLRVADRR